MTQDHEASFFQYQPLPSQNCIRLLTLMPGEGDAKLSFTLISADLSSESQETTPYEALSYTWGDPTEKLEVWCSGLPFLVMKSLYSALSHLRYPDRLRIFWIDAICINQNDLEERTAQVALMKSIYTEAEKVIIWLGAQDDLTPTAVNAVTRLGDFCKISSQEFSTSQQKVGLENLSKLEVIALARLFQRPWFKRVWVVQEAVCATNAIVVCGACSIEWNILGSVCQSQVLRDAARVSASMIRASPGILAVRRIQKLRQGESSVALLDLLASVRVLDATDPRDKLFAIQSLANEKEAGPPADYNASVEDIYIQYAIKSVERFSVDILSAVNPSGIRTVSKTLNLPSWVPDWSQKLDFTNYPGEHLPLIMTANHFQAGGALNPICFVSKPSNALVICGAAIDTITALGPEGAASTRWDESFADLDFQFLANSDLQPLYHTPQADTQAAEEEEDDDRTRLIHTLLLCDTDMHGARISPRSLKLTPAHRAFAAAMCPDGGSGTTTPPALPHLPSFLQQPFHPSPILQQIRAMSWGRRSCATAAGRPGWVTQQAALGDLVCYLLGARVLMLLRPRDQADATGYTLVGECYVHGLMHGEAMAIPGSRPRNFEIY